MARTSPSIAVHVKITVEPSNIDAFLQALKPAYESVAAEPLNESIELYQDAKTPGVFRLIEKWNASMDHLMNVSIYHCSLLKNS
jgi:quinol monooxygenase YgiN